MSFLEPLKVSFLKAFAHFKVFKHPFFLVWDPHTFDVKGNHYYAVKDTIQAGDILLRSYRNYLDGYFIPGKYSHAALYVGDEKIIHAMTPDVQSTDLVTFMRCDRICVIRPDVTEADKQLAIQRVKNMLGKPYDYDFVFEPDGAETETTQRKFSCSELIYFAFDKNLADLKWGITEKNYLFFTKSLFAPDACLPKSDSSSHIIFEGP
ncbi:MAG: YiiX/YebB-like N1pC/P60 family cysteine hydrolase [Methylococcales bacterium]|nr:YiiX/YebB-like N1pC/P60 family cysteine hydrolase [Methylococcales bacterium]